MNAYNVERYVFDCATGIIGPLYTCPPDQLGVNTPPGCDTVDAALIIDAESQRINPVTRAVEDWQPPSPGADHEWIHDDDQGNRVRRWVIRPEAIERQARQAAARTRIAELEGKLPRALREHALGIVPSAADIAAGAMTLLQIDAEIEKLRLEV